MGCRERETKLTDWIMGELSPAEARELEQHVEQCAECARSLGRLRQVRQALMKNLTDREMPAHLVFLGERPKNLLTGFLTSLWRTTALAAVAAVVFLGVFWGGFAHWRDRLLISAPAEKATLTRTEIKALTAQAVEEQLALQRKELETANEELAASLRQEQMRNLARLAQQLQYLESAQSTVWKEAQQQNELVELIARNSLEPKTPPLSKP